MNNPSKKFLSPRKLSQLYGIPETMIRRDIKRGLVPGFYSGTWFHIDVDSYIDLLTKKNLSENVD